MNKEEENESVDKKILEKGVCRYILYKSFRGVGRLIFSHGTLVFLFIVFIWKICEHAELKSNASNKKNLDIHSETTEEKKQNNTHNEISVVVINPVEGKDKNVSITNKRNGNKNKQHECHLYK